MSALGALCDGRAPLLMGRAPTRSGGCDSANHRDPENHHTRYTEQNDQGGKRYIPEKAEKSVVVRS